MLFLTPKLRLRLWNALSQPYFHYTCLAWYANLMAFKYFNEQCPSYLNEVFDLAAKSNFQLEVVFKNQNVHFERLITVNTLCVTKSLTHSNVVTVLILSNII